MELFIAILVMTAAGFVGLGLGIWWDHICHKHNWRGWYIE